MHFSLPVSPKFCLRQIILPGNNELVTTNGSACESAPYAGSASFPTPSVLGCAPHTELPMAVPKTALKCAISLPLCPISPSSTEAPPAPHFSTMSVGSVLLLLPAAPWSARAPSPLRSPSSSRSDLRVWCGPGVSPSPAPSSLAPHGPSQHEEPLADSQHQAKSKSACLFPPPSPTSLSDLPGVVSAVSTTSSSLASPGPGPSSDQEQPPLTAPSQEPLCLFPCLYMEAPPAPHFSSKSVGSVLLLPAAPWSARALSPSRSPSSSPLASPFPLCCLQCLQLQLDVRCMMHQEPPSTKARAATQLVLMHLSPSGANSRSLAGQPAGHSLAIPVLASSPRDLG
jgi:hypothetical protein